MYANAKWLLLFGCSPAICTIIRTTDQDLEWHNQHSILPYYMIVDKLVSISGELTSINSMGKELDSYPEPYNYKAWTVTTTPATHLLLLQLFFTNHIAFSYVSDSNGRSWLHTFDTDWDRGRFPLWLILSWILSSLLTTKVRSALDLSARIKLLVPIRNTDTHHKLFNQLLEFWLQLWIQFIFWFSQAIVDSFYFWPKSPTMIFTTFW